MSGGSAATHKFIPGLSNTQYQPIVANGSGWLWSHLLDLYLGVQAGVLRYFTVAGDLVPSPEEEAEQAVVRVEAAEARAERLAERLRLLGVEPDL
jgi:hypothetical protein